MSLATSPPQTAPAEPERLDLFICVHHRDLGPLFELTLRSYLLNFEPKGRLFLISNDVDRARPLLDRLDLGPDVVLMPDDHWLSSAERELPGWYRQQIIKLRSHEFCETTNFCNLGADTVLLDRITSGDLVAEGKPHLYYSRYSSLPTRLDHARHFRYERERVEHVAEILHVEPVTARRYGDFVLDLFCFNREYLAGLNHYLERLHGPRPYAALLRGRGDSLEEKKTFGEWALYSVFLLDCLKARVQLRNAAPHYLRQLHSRHSLLLYRFDSKVVHFVRKDFDLDLIQRRIAAAGLPLGRYVAGRAAELAAC